MENMNPNTKIQDNSLVSTCCGYPPLGELYNSKSIEGTCSRCKDHASFESEENEEEV